MGEDHTTVSGKSEDDDREQRIARILAECAVRAAENIDEDE